MVAGSSKGTTLSSIGGFKRSATLSRRDQGLELQAQNAVFVPETGRRATTLPAT